MNSPYLYHKIKDKISQFLRCIARKFWVSSVLFILACFAVFFHRDLPIFKKVFNTDGQDELIFGLSAGLVAIYIFIGTSFSLSFDKTIHGEKYLGRPIFSSSISSSKSVIFVSNKFFKYLSYVVFCFPFLLPSFPFFLPLSGEYKNYLLSIWVTAFSILTFISINLSVQIISKHAIGLRNPGHPKFLIEKNILNDFNEDIKHVVKSDDRSWNLFSRRAENYIENLKNLPPDEQLQYLNLTIFNIDYYHFYTQKNCTKTFSPLVRSYHLEILKFLAIPSPPLHSSFKEIIFKILHREVLLLSLDKIEDDELDKIKDDILIRYGNDSYFQIHSTDITTKILEYIPYNLKYRYQNLFYCISLIGNSLASNYNSFKFTAAEVNEIFKILGSVRKSVLKSKLELILFKSIMIYDSQEFSDFNLHNVYQLKNSMYNGGDFARELNLSFEEHALEILSENPSSQNSVFKKSLLFVSPEKVRIKFLEILFFYSRFPDNFLNEFINYRFGEMGSPNTDKFDLGKQAFNSLREVSRSIDKESVIWLFEIAGEPLEFKILDNFYRLKEEGKLRGFSIVDLVRWIRFNLANSTNYYPIEQPYTLKITKLPWEFRYEIRNLISSFEDGNPPAGIKEGDIFVLKSFLNKLEEDSSSDKHTN